MRWRAAAVFALRMILTVAVSGGMLFVIGRFRARLMASLQASLRGQTIQGPGDLAAVIRNVNRLVYDASAANRYEMTPVVVRVV